MNAYAQQLMCIILSSISLIISQFSTIPQFIELKKTRNTSGISLLTYMIFVFTSFFWSAWSYMFYYGQMLEGAKEGVPVLMHQWGMIPTIIMNNANLLIMTTVLAIKLHHLHLCKKLNVSELKLSHILLKKDSEKYNSFGKASGFMRYLPQTLILFTFAVVLGGTTAIIILLGTPDKSPEGNPKWLSALTMTFNAIGAVTWEAVSWPQFIKSMREKDTTGISLAWAIFLPVSCTVLFFSDLLQGLAGNEFDMGIIFSLIFNGMISGYAVLFLKIRNIKQAKKHNMSEEQYTKQYLIPLALKKKKERELKKQSKKEA